MRGKHHWNVGSADGVVNCKSHNHLVDCLLAAKIVSGVENEFVGCISEVVDRNLLRNPPLLICNDVKQLVTDVTNKRKTGDPNVFGVIAADRI